MIAHFVLPQMITADGITTNWKIAFNPFSPKSDQHQISPCNINAYSIPEVMRIKDMITQGEFS